MARIPRDWQGLLPLLGEGQFKFADGQQGMRLTSKPAIDGAMKNVSQDLLNLILTTYHNLVILSPLNFMSPADLHVIAWNMSEI